MIVLPSVDSTNTYVKRYFASLSDGEGVLALEQTAGRGRLGRTWSSARGGLYISVFLKKTPELLPFRSALAVRDALPPGLDLRFKWPNDLLLQSEGRYKKLSGILCETFAGGCVAGIGVNLRFEGQPPTPNAVCLSEFCSPPAPETLGERVRSSLLAWLRPDPEQVLRAYRPYCATIGRRVTLPDGRSAEAEGICPDGRLSVRTSAGTETVGSGEVIVQGIY